MKQVGIDQIISVDLDTFELSLTPFARTIDCFKKLIIADRGSEGDSQGRKKQKAILQISYCYLMEKYGTVFFKWEERKRHDEVCKRLKFDIDQTDSDIIECREFIRESQKTPSFEALVEIKESYHSSTKMLKVMRKILEEKIDVLADHANLGPVDNPEEGALTTIDMIDQADKLLMKIRNHVSDFEKVLNTISSLEERVKEEQAAEERQIKGGGNITKYED